MYLADEERIGIGGANKSSVGIRPPLAGRRRTFDFECIELVAMTRTYRHT